MSHVLHFDIRGLNGRKKSIAHTLDRHVNVFFGSNGSGKTSILRIINSAMNVDAGSINTIHFYSASVTIHTLKYERELVYNYKRSPTPPVRDAGANPNADDLFSEIAEVDPERSGTWKTKDQAIRGDERRWAHVYLPTSRLYFGNRKIMTERYLRSINRPVQHIDPEENIDDSFAGALQQLWSRRFGAILTRVRIIQQEALEGIFLDALAPEAEISLRSGSRHTGAEPIDPNRAFERMSSFLRRQSNERVMQAIGSKETFAQRFENEARLRTLVNQIDVVESQIELEMRPIEELSKLVRRLFLGGKAISFNSPHILVEFEDGTKTSLERLSSGEKHLIRILVAAIEAAESTLLIDEPELSLHIDWQRELIQNIRALNPKCQLIFATHSPEVMADVPDENIFRI